MLIDGIHVPLTVPFSRDGALSLRKLGTNVRRYSLSPVAGLVALAPGVEAAALSDDECADLLRTVAQAASKEKVLVAGVSRESVHSARQISILAADAGFDAVLLDPPPLQDAEVRVFLQTMADASPLPVMLWSSLQSPLPVDLIAELSHHANVLGIYDAGLTLPRLHSIANACSSVKREVAVTSTFTPATRRMQAAQHETNLVPTESLGGVAVMVAAARPSLKLRTKAVGFQVMSAGDGASMLPLLESGVAGSLPRLATCAPQAAYEIYAAFKDGDPALSALKAEHVRDADKLLEELGIAGLKFACDLNGYYGGPLRLPRLGLTAADKYRVEQVLAIMRN